MIPAVLVAAAALGWAGAASADEQMDEACRALGAEHAEEITLGNGTTTVLCWFEDARACTLQAIEAGNCIEGGRKTTGFFTDAARYCAWIGGDVTMVDSPVAGLEEIDGTCELPDGSVCLTGRLYYGSCE
ncbi:MAG: hypothetical protein H6842_01495 [Rhodospirillaceae bacterium]|nr:hypothetical protein [Rhodospirillaceae bacterium]